MHVLISNLAAQSGASLFLQRNAPPFHPSITPPPPLSVHTGWVYDKTEGLSLADLTRSSNVTHLIAEASEIEKHREYVREWAQVATVTGFDGWSFRGAYAVRTALSRGQFTGLGSVLEMKRSAKLVVLERKVGV